MKTKKRKAAERKDAPWWLNWWRALVVSVVLGFDPKRRAFEERVRELVRP